MCQWFKDTRNKDFIGDIIAVTIYTNSEKDIKDPQNDTNICQNSINKNIWDPEGIPLVKSEPFLIEWNIKNRILSWSRSIQFEDTNS